MMVDTERLSPCHLLSQAVSSLHRILFYSLSLLFCNSVIGVRCVSCCRAQHRSVRGRVHAGGGCRGMLVLPILVHFVVPMAAQKYWPFLARWFLSVAASAPLVGLHYSMFTISCNVLLLRASCLISGPTPASSPVSRGSASTP